LNKALSGLNKDQDAIKITHSDRTESLDGEEWFGEKIIRTLSVTLSSYDPFLLENISLTIGHFNLTKKLPLHIARPEGHELFIEPWEERDYWKIIPHEHSYQCAIFSLRRFSDTLELWRKFCKASGQSPQQEEVSLKPYLGITFEDDVVLREGFSELHLGNAGLQRKLFRLVLERRGDAIESKDLSLDVYEGHEKSDSTFSSLKAGLNDKLMGLKLEIDKHNRLVDTNPKSR
jgi:hypothetical protein